jgi:hypothetical protein
VRPTISEADISPFQDWYDGVSRRRASRFHFDLATLGQLLIRGEITQRYIWLVDVSESGVGFFAEWHIEPGTEVQLTFRGKTPTRANGKIVYSKREPNDVWRTGCQFLTPITDDILDAIL